MDGDRDVPEAIDHDAARSIQVVVVFFGLSSGSNEELPPLGSRHAAMPMPASIPD